MKNDALVLRNSLWIGLQPLILNLVSIFVIGFIARTLGQDHYGRFVFAFSIVALLMPICNLGLRAVTVRDIAADREQGPEILGKVLVLRMVLAMLAYAGLVVAVNLLGYPSMTRTIVYIAGITLITQTAATTLMDGFQAYERMQFIAYANFISGTLLTAASIVVLLLGYGVVALSWVYTAGSVVLLIAISLFYARQLPALRISADRAFWRNSIRKGLPFFIVGMLSILNIRLGIVLLSKMSGDAAVGQYGAAYNLVERLVIISESLCTAIFPTLSVLYAAGRISELNDVLVKYFKYLVVAALPIAVGTALVGGNIVSLIYGAKFENSAPVLAILAMNLPFFFVASLLGYCLGAIHQQVRVVWVSIAAATVNVGLNLLLIPVYGANGVAVAYLASGVVAAIATFALMRHYTHFGINAFELIRIFVATTVLALVVIALRDFNWILATFASAVAYALALVLLKVMHGDDWRLFQQAIMRKRAPALEDEVTGAETP